jgi:hypothetical protein
MGLTAEQIQGLYAKRRVKGLYALRLNELMESDEPGVDPMEQWPVDFGGKNATTIYQGFRNAAEKLGYSLEADGQLDIMQRDEHVFILVTERCQLVLNEDEAEPATK